jgi:hypothetical protein
MKRTEGNHLRYNSGAAPRKPRSISLRCIPRVELPCGLGYRIVGEGIDQPIAQCILSIDLFGSHKHLQRLCFPHQSRQPLCSTPTGDQPQRCTAMSENHAGRRDASVTSEGKIEPTAHTVPFDGRVHRRRRTLDCIHQGPAHSGEFVGRRSGQSCNLSQISASREESPISRDDQRLGLARQVAKRLRQCQNATLRQAIRAILGLQAQHADAVMILEMKKTSS